MPFIRNFIKIYELLSVNLAHEIETGDKETCSNTQLIIGLRRINRES
jgi:hypothetical protein